MPLRFFVVVIAVVVAVVVIVVVVVVVVVAVVVIVAVVRCLAHGSWEGQGAAAVSIHYQAGHTRHTRHTRRVRRVGAVTTHRWLDRQCE
jgi:hypothetical protein